MAGSVSLPDLIKAIRGQIPHDKCDLLEDLVQKLQKREVRLNRQEFLHKVRDIAGEDAPALRQALKQLAVDRTPGSDTDSHGFSLSDLPMDLQDESDSVKMEIDMPTDGGALSSAEGPTCSAADFAVQSGADVHIRDEHSLETDPAVSAPLGTSLSQIPAAAVDAADQADSAGTSETAAPAASSADVKSEDTDSAVASVAVPPAGAASPAPANRQQAAGSQPPQLPPQQQQQQQQQQRLEVAAAAVLVHAASCKNPQCPVPHCNKMKKIHSHFLECSTTDCGICKKLKPLTYIHAKHCVAAPGEPCVIPYCARAKKELQALVQQRSQGALGPRGGCGSSGCGIAGSAMCSSMVRPGSTSSATQPGAAGSFSTMGANGSMGGYANPMGSADTVQAQAHYLLVLAHVMKCTNNACTVAECAPTKALVTNHTRSCRAGDACQYPRCALSKRLMRHHRECPDQGCPICLPLRRRLAAAKMGVVASSIPSNGDQQRRKPSKRKKEDEDDIHYEGGHKRKRKDAIINGSHKLDGQRTKKRGGCSSALHEAAEAQQVAAEVDVLESGFAVNVLFSNGRKSTAGDDARGEWRPGTVMRAYTAPHDEDPVYDIMMLSGSEEKAVQHNRCRMVCSHCLSDKRAFKPPPMFCEKCFAAIHTRWSYWEESGEEGGVKLCKRCYSDVKQAPQPDRLLAELAHRPNLRIDAFIEKKERDRPEYVDNWVQCDECHAWLHWTCALYKGEDTPEDCLFFCDNCRLTRGKVPPKELQVPGAVALPETTLSQELQANLKKELNSLGVQAAPVLIRVVSNIQCASKIDAVQNQQRTLPPSKLANGKLVKEFPYRSKCILAFQHVQGREVCFFAMYVQEYGSDCPEPNTNRVYISYLDSVRYFESSPDGHRTTVYHSILINYLNYAKSQGYNHAHIWVSPPKQGDDYIFYAHPAAMLDKRMGLLKLKEWYEKMLDVAKEQQVVVDFQDMMEEYKDIESAADIPVFSGDHWAASIANKMIEARKKEQELSKKCGAAAASHASGASRSGPGSGSAATSDPNDPTSGSGGSGLDKQDEQLLNQITEEMRSMRNHFIVVTLIELKKSEARTTIVDPVPLMSNEFVDKRSSFLEKCQMYHWQFDEVRNAQHSTLMLLYHLHGMHKAAVERKRLAAPKSEAGAAASGGRDGGRGGSSNLPATDVHHSRSSKIEMAMQDWTRLLNHANEAAAADTWELPPEELFLRILAQINRSKRDILQEKYNQCRDPSTSPATRSVFIRVLKRIAESFMSCLQTMSASQAVSRGEQTATALPSPSQTA